MASFADSAAPDRQRSPVGLHLNLPSNNPFRNRAASPSPGIPAYYSTTAGTPPVDRPPRPMSTNPFLDDNELSRSNKVAKPVNVPEDIFNELSLLDQPPVHRQNGAGAYIVRPTNGAPSRPAPPPLLHRPSGDIPRGPPRPPRGPPSPAKNGFGGPRPRPRRASESSVMEKDRRTRMDRDEGRGRTESEERRRRERRREREERHRREKDKAEGGGRPSKSKRPQGLDIIDKLDVTGIYGQGLFHHDGPFDACNPHRNAKRDRRAPMQAFPADSANMQLGGAGPLRSRLDLDKFHGRGEEGFSEYNTASKKPAVNVPEIIDPLQRSEIVHGQESYGLGTSTFLEGAPASRRDIQRRDSEDPEQTGGGGLSRKKSIAQRFRGMSASRRDRPADLRSPETRYKYGPASPPVPSKATSAGGPVQARYNKENEINPFENDYEAAFDKKGTQIRIAEQEKPSLSRQSGESSPRAAPPLTRTVTSDARLPSRSGRGSSGDEERPKTGGMSGLLGRMRSVKGSSRRQRSEALRD